MVPKGLLITFIALVLGLCQSRTVPYKSIVGPNRQPPPSSPNSYYNHHHPHNNNNFGPGDDGMFSTSPPMGPTTYGTLDSGFGSTTLVPTYIFGSSTSPRPTTYGTLDPSYGSTSNSLDNLVNLIDQDNNSPFMTTTENVDALIEEIFNNEDSVTEASSDFEEATSESDETLPGRTVRDTGIKSETKKGKYKSRSRKEKNTSFEEEYDYSNSTNY